MATFWRKTLRWTLKVNGNGNGNGQGERKDLMYWRAFAEAWPDGPIVRQLVGRLPWGHNLVLLTRLKDGAQRLACARAGMPK